VASKTAAPMTMPAIAPPLRLLDPECEEEPVSEPEEPEEVEFEDGVGVHDSFGLDIRTGSSSVVGFASHNVNVCASWFTII
jgi:hypothetical protein